MRLWTDDFDGRLFITKQFLEVRSDPFSPSDNVKNRYVMRIEVYPETEDDKYFDLQLKKDKKVIKI